MAKAIGGQCRVDGNRLGVVCEIKGQDAGSVDEIKTKLERVFGAPEWNKRYENEVCNAEVFEHPGDSQDHTSVEWTASNAEKAVLRINAPKRSSHEHDGFQAN